MKRRTIILIAGIASALVLASGVALAQATQDTIVSTYNFEGMFPLENPCNGEILDWGGVTHDVYHETLDPMGGTHGTLHAILRGTAVGTESGRTYLVLEVGGSSSYIGPRLFGEETFAPAQVTDTATFLLLEQDPEEPGFMQHITAHVTVNANGERTVDYVNGGAFCLGSPDSVG